MALMYSKTEQCSYSNFQNGPHVLKNWAMLQGVSVKFSAGFHHCLMGGLLANQWHYVLSVSLSVCLSLCFTVIFPCSDVVVQIVDARNPLLFWCPDLDKYVQEVDPQKQTLLLVNKADLLSANQRLVLTCQKTEAGNVVGVWFSGEWESCDQFGKRSLGGQGVSFFSRFWTFCERLGTVFQAWYDRLTFFFIFSL